MKFDINIYSKYKANRFNLAILARIGINGENKTIQFSIAIIQKESQ